MVLSSFLLYAFVSSFTPGPNNIMALFFANKFGFRRGFRFSLGVGLGFFILLVASAYFNVILKNILPKVTIIMTVIGVIYMIYLAYKIAWSSSEGASNNVRQINHVFSLGVILQFVNPKGVLYALTAVGSFVTPYYHSFGEVFFYVVILTIIGFAGTFSWVFLGTVFQKFLSQYERPFNIVMAILLLYSAAMLLIN